MRWTTMAMAMECAVDGGGWDGAEDVNFGDCDDTDDTINPGAPDCATVRTTTATARSKPAKSMTTRDDFVDCSVDEAGWDGEGTWL